MSLVFSGSGVTPGLKGLPSNEVTLQAGETWIIQPAGWYFIKPDKYSNIQEYDPISGLWLTIGGFSGSDATPCYLYCDGVNRRLANQTGCAVGALLTNAGSGYTSAPTVTASAGGSIWRAIVGGAVNTSVTVTNGGTGYTYPPNVQISAPPAGGVQATGYCTLSGSEVSTVTITNQGAGYTSAPTITFVNDSREGVNGVAIGSGAAATTTTTGAGTVTAVVCLDHGTPLTSIPTLSFSGGGGSSAAATTIMCWTITSYTAGTAGAGLAGTVARITAEDAFPTTSPAYTNPATQSGLVTIRSADIKAPISGAGITATGQVVYDGGIYTSSPTPLVIPTASIVTTAPVVTFAVGGASGTSFVQPL